MSEAAARAPIRVTHLITGLNRGGAEIMLYRLLEAMDRTRFEAVVISMTDRGPVSEMIERLGVPVKALGMRRGVPDPRAILRLSRMLRESDTDLLQTWMYQADLLGGIAAKFAGGITVVWGIHFTGSRRGAIKRLTRATTWVNGSVSRMLPTRIVCCADAAYELHRDRGYDAGKMLVIPNGFEVDPVSKDHAERESVRSELGLPLDAYVIGRFGRFHPQKDHRTFFRAVAIISRRRRGVYFVLCGDRVTEQNPELREMVARTGVRERILLLGIRDDTQRLNRALDLAVSSSSLGEAFPLVVGEAMAAGVPCVVTDVGDSAKLVAGTGIVVPPSDPVAMAIALERLVDLTTAERAALGDAARRRIRECFSIASVAQQYSDLYMDVARLRKIEGVA